MTPLLPPFKTMRGLDSGPLCPYVQPFIIQHQTQGYRPLSIRAYLRFIANLNRWLARTGRDLRHLNETVIERFWRRRLGGRKSSGHVAASLRLLTILRAARAIPPAVAVPLTPAQRLALRYRRYLLQERGCSDWTVDNYGRHIDRFVAQQFGAGAAQPSRIEARGVIGFVQQNARTHQPSHSKKVVTALRSFLRFLHYQGLLRKDLAPVVPAVAHWRMTGLPKHLPAEAVQKVIEGCDQTTPVGRRNYAILLLLARLGLRAGEVVALQLDDIDWEHAQLCVRSKKGRGWARMPLPREVGQALAGYLRHSRPACASRAVFVRSVAPHTRLSSVRVIAALTRRALEKAGVESARKGAHVFRHSLATAMLGQGASLDEIGQVLRHQDPETTAIYAKVDLAALRRLVVRWPGGRR